MNRRQWLALGAWGLLPGTQVWAQSQGEAEVVPVFPRDHGGHLSSRTEWWTLKGEVQPEGGAVMGFHMAFLRFAVEAAQDNPSRFAPKQVLVARASLSDEAHQVLWHDQRMARTGFGLVDVAEADLSVKLQDWTLSRQGAVGQSRFTGRIQSAHFALDLACQAAQPVMLHGDHGVIHRDPFLGGGTRYVSVPQLAVSGQVRFQGRAHTARGRAWLDHGWGKRMMAPDAVGSDWVCINLKDGSALMAFRMRRMDGTTVWEGATLRRPGRPDLVYKHEDIRLTPGETWRSPATGAQYPMRWRLDLAGTSYTVRTRMQAQEVDGGNGVGDVFWEGLSDLLDEHGQVLGSGYLEMTGYAGEMLL